jgi:hypothetical protein
MSWNNADLAHPTRFERVTFDFEEQPRISNEQRAQRRKPGVHLVVGISHFRAVGEKLKTKNAK